MKSSQKLLAVTASLAVLFLYGGLPAHGQHGGHGGGGIGVQEPQRPFVEKLRVREDGVVAFRAPTVVGEWIVPPGEYRFEHVVEGEEHFVAIRTSDAPPASPPAVRVRCRLEALRKPAKKTEVFTLVNGAGPRTVERIQVQGESVKHLF